jgi:tetratricopeptide (TPR) repeat protein
MSATLLVMTRATIGSIWRWAPLVLAALVVWPSASRGQGRSLARLERELSRSPEDTRLLCEVGWARFLTSQPVDRASRALDRGIELLGEPTDPALRSRLAACLYSRGRVYEASRDDERAIRSYERSLGLRPNNVVARRLGDLRATLAAGWVSAEAPREAPAELMRALGASDRDDVDVLGRYVSPDARSEALILGVRMREHEAVLAVRDPGGAWSTTRITGFMDPNGFEDFTIEAAPGPRDRSPTFVVRQTWEHRTCCDDDGYPDWTEGGIIHLAWREADGAWSVASLGDADDVSFTAEGGVVVEELSGGARRAQPARPREALLAPR